MLDLSSVTIGIVGLGYVGLPLAVEFGKQYKTTGYDINCLRIEELNTGVDSTREVSKADLQASSHLSFSSRLEDISNCDVYIVTVPTPVDNNKNPDLSLLINSSSSLGTILTSGNIVIYESTVYPGATEEVCVPALEKTSSLKYNQDFFIGYSPERINPGDRNHHVTRIQKITSGSTDFACEFIDKLYRSIITAGTYKASSIKVAEAAKVIENVQRDVNIALINELSLIFSKLDIDTLEVLEAAGTKWNFLNFRPGLVGGHCIGVDPYYLVHKAQQSGFEPIIIPASRQTNEYMATHVVLQVVRLMSEKRINVVDSRVLIMGLAFKENCPDLRNTKVVDIISEFAPYNAQIDVIDPWVNEDEALREHQITLTDSPDKNTYDAVIIAVAHDQFKELGANGIRAMCKENCVIYDVKYLLKSNDVDGRL